MPRRPSFAPHPPDPRFSHHLGNQHTVRTDGVPATEIQRALKNSGLTIAAAAALVGYTCPGIRHDRANKKRYTRGDTSRLKRKIGLLAHSPNGRRVQYVAWEDAERMLSAWGLDPVDYGA
jgi:hypothetical protein